jgi:chromosome partitioning protein
MKRKIIAIANHKGGVAKTTTTANLGAALNLAGYRVLVVDLDAQCNLTASLCNELIDDEATTYGALKSVSALPVRQIKEGFDLCPASLNLSGIDQELADDLERNFRLTDCLNKTKEYDYILLDCPPSLGLLTVNALIAANEVYITLTAEGLPTMGLSKLSEMITKIQNRLSPALNLSGIVITRYNGRKLNKTVEDSLRARFGDIVFDTKIRENIALAEAPLFQQDIFVYAPESNGAKDYTALAEEVISRK